MIMTNNQRPGVYARYDTSTAYSSPQSQGYAAVIAKASGGAPGTLYTFTSIAQLMEAFPLVLPDKPLRECVQILLQSGVSKVYAVCVEQDFYEDAFALIEEIPGIRAVICDCSDDADFLALRDSVVRSAQGQRERIAYCGTSVLHAVQTAELLNSERVVLCCPSVMPFGSEHAHTVFAGAAMAGRVLSKNDPTWNYSGDHFLTVHEPIVLTEHEIQALLAAGITVFEQGEGAVECVRALTTRTKTGGELDYALRGLNAVLCIDDVMLSMRAALRAALHGSLMAERTLQAVRSQAAVVLAEKQDRGIVAAYQPPNTYGDPHDPSICVVELAFHIAHVINQIHITAHIQV